MSRDIAPFGVRMPSELKEELTWKAKQNKRSLNAEIVSRLEVTLHQDAEYSSGHEELLYAYQDLEKQFSELQDEFDEFKYQSDPKSASIQTSLDELKEMLSRLQNP